MSIYKGNSLVAGGSQVLPLLTFIWSDCIKNHPSWLRADTFSWQSGAVYQAAYQHLVNDLPEASYGIVLQNDGTYYRYADGDVTEDRNPYCWSNGTSVYFTRQETPSVGDYVYQSSYATQTEDTIISVGNVLPTPETETIAGITISFYTADDGHKLVLPDQESNVTAIYNATGVAWYYIIDTTNQRFKLPRSSHNKYTTELGVIGTGKTLGLTDGTNNYGLCNGSTYARVTVGTGYYGSSVSASGGENAGTGANRTLGVTTDSTKSGIKTTTITQDTDQYKYLYFYVGNFTQTALENTAGLNTELFNGKADLSTVAHVVTEFQEPTAANNYTWYRKYADGWVEQGAWLNTPTDTAITITIPVPMVNTNYSILFTRYFDNAPGGSTVDRKFGSVWTKTTTAFNCWAKWGGSTGLSWQVSGMAAN